MMEIRLGIYRHYKGPLYQVLGIAHDANAEDLFEAEPHPGGGLQSGKQMTKRTVVMYMPLQLDAAHLGPHMAVRTLEDFVYPVPAPFIHVGRMYVPRFEYLGPELTAEMMPS